MEYKDRQLISDYEFDALINRIKYDSPLYYEDFVKRQLTPEQVTKVCSVVIDVRNRLTANILTAHPIPHSGVEILLNSPRDGDRMFLLGRSPHLSEEHIIRLLSDASSYVREAAYRHPCCSDAMKVAYHLKWGE